MKAPTTKSLLGIHPGMLTMFLMATVPAVAAPQRVDSPTFSAGGGMMSGGRFSVTSTLGESAAGVMEAPPADQVVAGFWGAVSAGSGGGPGGPLQFVAIEVVEGAPVRVQLRFEGDAGTAVEVQSAPSIDGPWTRVGRSTLSGVGAGLYSEVLTVGPTFYRLVR